MALRSVKIKPLLLNKTTMIPNGYVVNTGFLKTKASF
jgi:hypothetical protein